MALLSLRSCTRQLCVKQILPISSLQMRQKTDKPFFYSKHKGVSRDWLVKLHQPIDFSLEGIQKWMTKKKWEAVKEDQKFNADRQSALGSDIGAAHFIVARGGAVKFKGSDRWIEKNKDGQYHLPKTRLPNLFVEAIDCSNVQIMYDSFENFNNLPELKYLKLSGCVYVDDYCMDRISNLYADTLVHLDLSGCPNISERGLAVIHRLRKLQFLELRNMSMIPNPALISIMIEEVLPQCKVIDVDYTQVKDEQYLQKSQTPGFVKNLDQFFQRRKEEEEKEYYVDNLIERRGKGNT